jgi:Ca-activated chloride channel family protein
MEYPMKNRIFIAFAATVLLATGAAAQNSQDLPSAPSATVEQNRPKPVPIPPPQTAPSNQTSAPANTSTQTPSTTQAPAPAQSAPVSQTPAQAAASKNDATNNPDGTKPDSTDDNAIATYKVGVNEVNLIFTVTDKRGRFIKDLKKDDLKILDDNKPPKAIRGFVSQTNLPLRVGLLIDSSNSIRDRFKFEQEAAIEFLNQIVRPKSDQAFVIGFDSTAEVTQDFTDSTEKLSKGVRVLRPGGGTALFDAIYFACRDKLLNASASAPTRRAIILLSDGDDNQSRVTREEAIDMAQRAEVIIYAISTNITGVKQRGDKVLERFAETTGGQVFFPFKIQDVADAFNDIQNELRSQYALAYSPADFVADGHYRPIQIEPANKKNLKVRARKGYYAPKQ